MEWKIGEIKQIKDEWYQCVEHTGCYGCAFDYNYICNFKGLTYCSARSDDKNIIYKKLEKVGEPYYDKNYSQVLQKYIYYIPAIIPDLRIHILGNNIVGIEIKQNKENMEEKKQKMDKLVTDYSANKITYKEFEKSIIELYVDKHTEVNKPKLKEFDLEAAKAGKPVCTRDGRKARIICFDRNWDMHIVALVADPLRESVHYYLSNGKVDINKENNEDLMMLPEKKEGWVNIYRGQVYNTPEKAEEARKIAENSGDTCIKTIKIDWEE